jgi:osmoprotectant transport system ATP-binding protein
MIAVDGLTKRFGNSVAVDGISFSVNEGERLVLLGRSGSGKTTTLRMINRLSDPDSGTISINGTDTRSMPVGQLRKGIGYVLQHYGLFPHYTVSQNIATVPRLLKWDKKQISERIAQLMAQLHLPASMLNQYPHKLSGGQQQRVGLARALAADPPILLMDEPFGALDPITRMHLRKEFRQLKQLRSKTVILVTHDVQEAFELGDRVCLMEQGKIVQIGKPAELLFSPANEFVSAFLNDHRLFMEMQLVTVADLWDALPSVASPVNSNEHSYDAGMSLKEALQAFPHSGQGSLTILNEQRRERKLVGFTDLVTAYGLYKTAQSNE